MRLLGLWTRPTRPPEGVHAYLPSTIHNQQKIYRPSKLLDPLMWAPQLHSPKVVTEDRLELRSEYRIDNSCQCYMLTFTWTYRCSYGPPAAHIVQVDLNTPKANAGPFPEKNDVQTLRWPLEPQSSTTLRGHRGLSFWRANRTFWWRSELPCPDVQYCKDQIWRKRT